MKRQPEESTSETGSEVSEQGETNILPRRNAPQNHPVVSVLRRMLSASFFGPCSVHARLKKNECTFYCLSCGGNKALCAQCVCEHENHKILQVRRYVYSDVVNTGDISSVMNINGIQTYIINAAPVVFLKDRPQTQASRTCGKGGTLAKQVYRPETV
uniref:Platz transcription factor n=1 Tax=Tetraselmis sp. GSL018 TaxID=582737 RepID=A0A061RXI8_9CHLO